MKSTDFQYDVFISFSTLDYNWVRDNLTPVLERKRINYCIHSRDFIVGKTIIENIADSVYNSRKVLAVISRNYLASNFCREELEIALYRSTEMADSSLLLIRLDGVDKKNLPKTLRRRTFLDYSSTSERMDWEGRLLKQIELDNKGFHVKQSSSVSTDRVQLISDSNVINLWSAETMVNKMYSSINVPGYRNWRKGTHDYVPIDESSPLSQGARGVTSSWSFVSLWKILLVLIYPKLHSKSCDLYCYAFI